MIEVPKTYSEWVNVIDIFKNKTDDEEVLKAMKAGTIQWQTGVAERFSKKLIDAVNIRMNAATDKFQLAMSRSHGSEGDIVQAIITLRKEMMFLKQALDLPAIPENERKHYIDLVVDQAGEMQMSLERSAANDRTGKLSSIIRNHKVNSF